MGDAVGIDRATLDVLTWAAFASLAPVTIGSVIGRGLLVGAAYWLIYLRL